MEQIASQTVGAVVNILTGIFTKHLRYLTSSRKYVTDMTNRLNVLVGKSGDVKRLMDKNKEDRKEIPTRVPSWLDEVENIKKDVESISSNVFGCLHMKKRYRAGRKASKVIEKIERLIDEEKEINWSDDIIAFGKVYSKLASTSAPSPPVQITQNDFVSRDEAFKDALKFLQQEGEASQVIALCGMGGVGKTTMMEQLKEVAEDSKMFHWIVKVTIGQNPNMFSVQNDVAYYLMDQDLPAGASKILRADHLGKKIKNLSRDGKKILVILDDVWDNIELKDIGLTSPLPKGIKLLLTSRDSKICKQIAACVHSKLQEVPVDVLKETEARSFFSQIAGISKERDHDLYHIGCDIVKKCGYLPLAIKLIASTLNSQKERIWRDTQSRLVKDHFNEVVQEIIRICYDYIKKDEQQILLLCGLFPEDFNIPIEDLMRHAWGLKLFKDVFTLKEARDRTCTYVHNLICANLLMNGDHLGYVKMHDLVLAFVLGEVSKGDYAWIINHGDVSKWEKDERCESCKSISLTCRGLSEFPTNIKYPNLYLLQLIHGDMKLTISDDFYENVKNVKVIAYYKIWYPLLPSSLTNLTNLCLHKCFLMSDCSFVGDLVNLEVLSFAHSDISKLPSTIGNLRNLKLLDLTGCIGLHIDDGVFKNLVNLEELYMRVAIRFTQANIEELKMLLSKLCALEVEFVKRNTWPENFSFMKLDEFKISIGCRFNISYNDEWSFRNMLKLATDATNLRDCKINELINKTENLYLHVKDMICLEDVVSIGPSNPYLFCNLRVLEVFNCADLKYLFPIYVATGLRKLECLKISECFALEALVHNDRREIISEDEIIKFEKLKFLSLEYLPKLVTLFPVELPQLVELKVNELPNFTSIYPYKNNSSILQQPLFNSQSFHVRGVSWSLSQYSKEIPKDEGKSLMQVFETQRSNNDTGGGITNTSIQERNGCTNSSRPEKWNAPQLFNNLKELEIRSCNLLKHVFMFSTLQSLTQLEVLRIRKCEAMEVIVKKENEEQRKIVEFPRLKFLTLDNLPKLKGFFLGINEFRWPQLEDVKIINCPQIMVFTCGASITSKLKYIHTSLGKHSLECGLNFRVTTPHQTQLLSSESRGMCSTTFESLPWSFHNLIEINKQEDWTSAKSIIPFNGLLQLQKLESIRAEHCYGVEEVFEVKAMEVMTSESQTLVSIPKLTQVELTILFDLKYIWKSNHRVLKFPNLTKLSVNNCQKLEHVFTSSMVGSFLQLQELHVYDCYFMEKIVKEEEFEYECDAKVKEIVTFPCLKSLILVRLESLRGFCLGKDDFSCPLLHTLVMKTCPKITIFAEGDVATPSLHVIETIIGRFYIKEDLNSFIKAKRHEGLEFWKM